MVEERPVANKNQVTHAKAMPSANLVLSPGIAGLADIGQTTLVNFPTIQGINPTPALHPSGTR